MLDTPAPIATLEPRLLADQIERTTNEVFDDNKLGILLGTPGWKTKVTRLIKQTIGISDRSLATTLRLPVFRISIEAGYMMWFGSCPATAASKVVMAMESELDPIAITIDDDFLKLLDSTAHVRVWLTCVTNSQSVERHLTSYLKEAERFKKMIPGTMFIFIVFDLENRRITTKRHTIGQLSAGHHSRRC